MKKHLISLISLLITNLCFSQNIGKQAQILNQHIGELGKPLGTTVTVQGVAKYNTSKGYESGFNLTVQTINDSLIQQSIKIPLSPFFGEFGDKPLPKLEDGYTYRLRVYETGEFVGVPTDAYNEIGIIMQTSGFYFQNSLVVISGEKIKRIQTTPNNFIGRIALISGIAKNDNDTAIIQTSSGKLRIIGFRKWTELEIGKLAEVYGIIEPAETKDIFNVRNCNPRLVKLEDQLE